VIRHPSFVIGHLFFLEKRIGKATIFTFFLNQNIDEIPHLKN